MLAAMRMITTSLVLAIAALSTATAYATPGNDSDDLDNLLKDRGLMTQIKQVRQNVGHRASELVVTAMGFLGVPYKWGGNTAEDGFDCSGFVRSMYQQSIGLLLPRRAEQQAAATQQIEQADMQPGDLVFFNTMRRAFSHVGIYVGDGKFIHAPRAGAHVRVESMEIGYWQRRFDGARRVTTANNAYSSPASAPIRGLPATSSFGDTASLR